MAKKTSFKRGTRAQKARSKVAEQLKRRGMRTSNAFALASYIACAGVTVRAKTFSLTRPA